MWSFNHWIKKIQSIQRRAFYKYEHPIKDFKRFMQKDQKKSSLLEIKTIV